MKSVLISIQPYWAFLIVARIMGWDISQEKTIEVRKDYPKDKEWNSVTHIYCSKDRKSFNRIPKQFQPFMKRLLGKVIGSFVCDKIEEFHEHELSPSKKFYEFEKARLDLFLKESCLSYNEVCDYRRNLPYYKPLYAWHISDLKIYDKPRELGEFFRPCPFQNGGNYSGDCLRCDFLSDNDYGGKCTNVVKRPFQSWGYVRRGGGRMITKEELSKMTAIEKAAEYIYGSELDFCKCCADYEACKAEMNELYEQNENNPNYIPPTPPKEVCVSNIVKFFENETN